MRGPLLLLVLIIGLLLLLLPVCAWGVAAWLV